MRRCRLFWRIILATCVANCIVSCGPSTPACAPPARASSAPFADIPAALSLALGDIAAPGEPFDATDVVVTGQNRRVMFIWHAGSRWVVATERGGIGYNNPVLAYDLDEDGKGAIVVAERTAFPETVCSTATDLLQ